MDETQAPSTELEDAAFDDAASVEQPGIVGIGGDELTDYAAEQQLIGALAGDPEKFAAIEEHVFEEDFFDGIHRNLFGACALAHRDGYAVGIKQLCAALGGPDVRLFADGTTAAKYVGHLVASHDSGLRVSDLAERVHELADRRAAEMDDMRNTPQDPESRFGAIRFRDLDAPGPEYDYLIKGLLTRRERSLLVGPSGSGKSFVAADLAFNVATGAPFLGKRVRQGLVLYQAGEGSLGLKKRIRAIRKERGIPADKNLPFVLMTSAVDLYANDADTIAFIKEARAWAEVYKREAKVGLELIVIDTLSAATPGANENASEDMSKILARCALIAKHCECHVMLVHHLNAAGSRPRGHSSLFANIENAIEVAMTDKTCAGIADDGHEITRKVRLAKVTKQKDGDDGIQWEFALKRVVLGSDLDGDDISSCVVVGIDDGEVAVAGTNDATKKDGGPGGFKVTKQEALFFECVLEAMAEHGIAPPPGLELPSSILKVVDYEHVKARMGRKILREDDSSEDGKRRYRERLKSATKRARETLTRCKVIGTDNPYIWHTGKPVQGFPQTQPARQDLLSDRRGPDDDDLGDFV